VVNLSNNKVFNDIIRSWKEARIILVNGVPYEGFKTVYSMDDDGALEDKNMIYYDCNKNFWFGQQSGGLDLAFSAEEFFNSKLADKNILTVNSLNQNSPIIIQPLFERNTRI